MHAKYLIIPSLIMLPLLSCGSIRAEHKASRTESTISADPSVQGDRAPNEFIKIYDANSKSAFALASNVNFVRVQDSGTASLYHVKLSYLTKNQLGGNNILEKPHTAATWLYFNAAAYRFCDTNVYYHAAGGVGQVIQHWIDFGAIVCYKRAAWENPLLTYPSGALNLGTTRKTTCDGRVWNDWSPLTCAANASRFWDNGYFGAAPFFVQEFGNSTAVFTQPVSAFWIKLNIFQRPFLGMDLRIPAGFDTWYWAKTNAAMFDECRKRGGIGGQLAELDATTGDAYGACVR